MASPKNCTSIQCPHLQGLIQRLALLPPLIVFQWISVLFHTVCPESDKLSFRALLLGTPALHGCQLEGTIRTLNQRSSRPQNQSHNHQFLSSLTSTKMKCHKLPVRSRFGPHCRLAVPPHSTCMALRTLHNTIQIPHHAFWEANSRKAHASWTSVPQSHRAWLQRIGLHLHGDIEHLPRANLLTHHSTELERKILLRESLDHLVTRPVSRHVITSCMASSAF